MKCPKCGSEARDIARFCRRCHATLRYQCPSCRHEQRQGSVCENCGIDFLKYVNAVVAERRSTLLKDVLWAPLACCVISSLSPAIVADHGQRASSDARPRH